MDKKQIKQVAKKKAKKAVPKTMRRMGLADLSPYLRSLLDPINQWGSKIPDTQTAPSFVVHCVQRIQVALAQAAGPGPIAAGIFVTLGDLRSAATGFNYTVQGGAIANQLVNTAYTKSYGTQVAAVAQALRPVSAAVYMAYQGSPLNAKGRVSVSMISPTQTGTSLPPVDINADVTQLPYLSTLPANAGFAQVKYLPIDPLSKSYAVCPAPFVRGLATGFASSFGSLYILVDGGTAGDILEFTVVENFECLPLNQAVSLAQPTPSKSDPIEMAAVDNLISSRPTLAVQQDMSSTMARTAVTTSTQSVSPAVHDPSKHESGLMDKILGGIGVGLDFIEKQAPKVARIASIAAPLLL